ncbi:fungal-specific transcription factor domain-containing protein [Armillaria novae-zelandiae]|uniref:Fungal-specific transcription factor domain-containing protein n=1 Tax=Armillaria novae-zelandiae TaxID=153914 RepID=A0AA39P9Q3_9AGAR|nr:fungal-specific transcription factor domain-containing protein [Armillaria novae-zelandiae]
MSSNDDEYNDHDQNPSSKKRRVQRACDICRRKKSDGVQMPENRCSNCIAYNFDCTYVEAAKKRGPPKGSVTICSSYVESLENRLEKMDKLLHRLMPEADFTKEVGGGFDRETWSIEKLPTSLDSGNIPELMRPKTGAYHPRDIATSAIRAYNEVDDKLLEDDFDHLTLADNLQQKIEAESGGYRFFGKSSGAQLIKTAMDLKHGHTGYTQRDPLGSKRSEFWTTRPWESAGNILDGRFPSYSFPEDDLLLSLIELYFANVNIFLPLLHRPTFERSIRENLHMKDEMFGAVLLLVCAVASRYSNDMRVLLDGEESRHSSGWKWFDQVQLVRKSLLSPPSLYDLQFYCFLQGSSAPQASWTMVGIGIRLAQDVGAHRRRRIFSPNTVEDELWKRAFWGLVCMDRISSSALGRPCAIQDEDIDIDFPAECDDEYWEHPDPEQAFKQPPGKPSYVAFFNSFLKLNQLLSFCLRTIYSINKSKILLGFVGQQWEQHIVAELDSALNKWVDSIPDHLRWDPNRDNPVFFNQSAYLYIAYYHLQILIHRPFIPTPRNPSPLLFPSLAICTNAARSCSHVVDIQSRKGSKMPGVGIPVFTAGIVLLFNIWGGKRSGLSIDPNREMGDVHKCMRVLRSMESSWHFAGRLWDILYELASVGDLPLPKASPTPTNKRERDSDSPRSVTPAGGSPSSGVTDVPATRAIVGSRRISNKESVSRKSSKSLSSESSAAQSSPLPAPVTSSSSQQLFSLPMYSDELGRIPLHGQVSFSNQVQAPDSHGWYAGSSSHGQVPSDGSGVQSDFSFMSQPFYEQVPPPGYTSTHYEYGRNSDMHEMMPIADNTQIRQPPPQIMDSRPQELLDNDTITMWSNAPSGFELDDWGTYLTNVSEMHNPHGNVNVPGPR